MSIQDPDYWWKKQLEVKDNKILELSNSLINRNNELIKAIEKISFLELQLEQLNKWQWVFKKLFQSLIILTVKDKLIMKSDY